MLTNRTVVAPFMIRPNMLWSNYWGNIASNGFYARSRDYNEIVGYKRLYVRMHQFIPCSESFAMLTGVYGMPHILVMQCCSTVNGWLLIPQSFKVTILTLT